MWKLLDIKKKKTKKIEDIDFPYGDKICNFEQRDKLRKSLEDHGLVRIAEYESKRELILRLNNGEFPEEFDELYVGGPAFFMSELAWYYINEVPENLNDLPQIINLSRNNIIGELYRGIGLDLEGIDFYYLPLES